VAKAEARVNSRPVSTWKPNDYWENIQILTPGHFAHGQLGGEVAPEADEKSLHNLPTRWSIVQEHFGRYAKEFKQGQATLMLGSHKWATMVEEMRVGTLVLIMDDNAKRHEWPLGLVLETIRSADGVIRAAKVRTRCREGETPTILTRNVRELVPLTLFDHHEDGLLGAPSPHQKAEQSPDLRLHKEPEGDSQVVGMDHLPAQVLLKDHGDKRNTLLKTTYDIEQPHQGMQAGNHDVTLAQKSLGAIEKEKTIIDEFEGKILQDFTTSEAGLSTTGTSENSSYVLESKDQTPAQVPLEDQNDPTSRSEIPSADNMTSATQNLGENTGKKTTTNKVLPDGPNTKMAKKLQETPHIGEEDKITSGSACQRPYAMLKAPVPSITVVKQH
jgi:hypothetical protein